MYEAKVLRHSVTYPNTGAPSNGIELVTFEVNYPHAIHKDVMTHRWARNFQSFRAIPPEVLLEKLSRGEYFIPETFGHRVKGMGQRNEPIEGQDAIDQEEARLIWQMHARQCIANAYKFLALGIAKQQVNFLLQDLCFIRGIITTTLPQLENFFGLRLDLDDEGHPVARPEVYKIASMMYEAWQASQAYELFPGDWHLPLVSDDEMIDGVMGVKWDYWKKVSVGRCARVSYLTHDGVRDPEKDIALHDQLQHNGHMSPFEHQGTPVAESYSERYLCGSFGYGWAQYRKYLPNEAIYRGRHALA